MGGRNEGLPFFEHSEGPFYIYPANMPYADGRSVYSADDYSATLVVDEQEATEREADLNAAISRPSDQALVREFHEAFGHPVADRPALIAHARGLKRFDFIEEEAVEFYEAVMNEDLVEIADALGDILYFVYGTAVEYGIDLDPVFREIHESNMSKLGEDGKPVPHPEIEGKIGKGPNFRLPDLRTVLIEQGADL